MSRIIPSFIVFEGLDGSGKSTQARLLHSALQKAGKDVVLTAEPTERPIGRLVRQVLRHEVVTTSRALALLYAADRSDHLSFIENDIAAGKTVISDRYFYSSLAYQGVTEDMDFLRVANGYPYSSHVIFVDTPAKVCMERIEVRGEEKELFDKLEYLEKVRSNFKEIFSTLPEGVKYLCVDGTQPIEVQQKQILDFING